MNGTIAYVSNADSGEISVLALDEARATLALRQSVPCGGTVMPLALRPDQRARIARAAEAFLQRHGDLAACAARFDLVAIGRPLIANPDYLAKVQQGDALVPYADTMLAELV